ncbi:hypothetical protein H9Y04_13440 [Streptomyces sp. TRM66268-LWL]|uniref:Uncharacterized protein n=1 Tax=Streptomyces polyasparticus TaxID=2767826 RepID=A0ABR7SFC2_9ACTN|nr:hypothetical protein [Streptomyces polyasparticus]MBC9713574.1 hypothetical protein [Streptomyces polyasparticus]
MEARHAAPRGTKGAKGRTEGSSASEGLSPETAGEGRSPEMSVTQVSGSALGAVSGALLASALGLFGTVAGAVIFSLTATVGGAAFQLGLHRTGHRYRTLRRTGPGVARTSSHAARTPSRIGRGSAPADVQDPHLTVGEQQRLAVGVGVDRRFLG